MNNKIDKKEFSLYLIATPIGNIEDITYRAIRKLSEVDEIYCEDTRQTKKLLNFYNINKPTNSYHDHNETQKSDEIIEKIKRSKKIALVSDAGMPLISDPGYKIVDKCIKEDISFTVIPGPNAAITALALSGLPVHNFFFYGFLPPKGLKRTTILESLIEKKTTIILYESTHKIEKLINELYKINKKIILIIAKELTKLNETIIRGSVEDFYNKNISFNKKGEFVVLFNGNIVDEE